MVHLQADYTSDDGYFSVDISKTRSRQVDPMGLSCSENDPNDYMLRDFERRFYEDCQPVVHVHANPNCNAIHEISLYSDIDLLSTKGSWRSVWRIEHHDAVIKLLSLSRNFDKMSTDLHAVDAIVMDRLTASPYVVNAYGYCSQSVSPNFL